MKHSLLITILCLFVSGWGAAQSLTNSNLYTFNKFTFNPSQAGNNAQSLDAYVNNKYQWAGFDDAPRLISFGLHSNVAHNMGLGGRFYKDKKGIFESVYTDLSYSYRVNLSEIQKLTFGVSAGFVRRQLNLTGNSAAASGEDPVFSNGRYNRTNFTSGFGLNYRYDKFRFDLALPSLLEEGSHTKINNHLIAMASYDFDMQGEGSEWVLTPSILYTSLPQNPRFIDANLKASWKQTLWVQTTYRTNNSYLFSFGVNKKGLGIAYAYEMNMGELTAFSKGGHEVSVFLNLDKKKTKRQMEREKQKALLEENTTLIRENMKRVEEMGDKVKDLNTRMEDQAEKIEVTSQKISKLDSIVDVAKDEVFTMDGNGKEFPIEKGYYCVIHTFSSAKSAQNAVNMLTNNNIYGRAAYNKSKNYYYVYTMRTTDRKEAIIRMRQLRQSGFKNAWVYVFKK